MNLPSNVRIKNFHWTILSFFSEYTAQAIYPNIYLPKTIYENLLSEDPQIKNIAILVHEQTHIDRQRELGCLLWGLKYCFDSKFRFEEELEAIKSSMKIYKEHTMTWDTNKSARYLSSYLYLWCCNYKKAKERLEHEWSN